MGILGSLERLLTAERDPTTNPRLGPADGPGDEQSTDRAASTLYECSDCETTYISTEMDDCPECRQAVEAVPDEYDLGLL